MSSNRFPLISGRVIRGTLLDSCARPAYGDRTRIVSEGFVSVAQSANYDDGDAVEVKNASGRRCVYRAPRPELTELELTITFCDVDPEFYTLVTGFPQVIDPATGDTIGYRVNRGIRPRERKLALETWMEAFTDAGCDDGDVDQPYGYLLWPLLSGGRVGDYTIEDNAVTFEVSGMVTADGSQWGEGPYLVQRDQTGTADTLQDPVDDQDHQVVFRTTVAPPTATTGLVPLDDPTKPIATGATAGTPGHFTPTGNRRPANLAALTGGSFTASPNTAWLTGQSVILGDGSFAHWTGTAWAAGRA